VNIFSNVFCQADLERLLLEDSVSMGSNHSVNGQLVAANTYPGCFADLPGMSLLIYTCFVIPKWLFCCSVDSLAQLQPLSAVSSQQQQIA
jgi:hypothetical protein